MATIFVAAIVIMIPWIAMLGEKGITPLVVCLLCALALMFTARGEVLRSPWLVLVGCLAGWLFVGEAPKRAGKQEVKSSRAELFWMPSEH